MVEGFTGSCYLVGVVEIGLREYTKKENVNIADIFQKCLKTFPKICIISLKFSKKRYYLLKTILHAYAINAHFITQYLPQMIVFFFRYIFFFLN